MTKFERRSTNEEVRLLRSVSVPSFPSAFPRKRESSHSNLDIRSSIILAGPCRRRGGSRTGALCRDWE